MPSRQQTISRISNGIVDGWIYESPEIIVLTHLPLDKMAAILAGDISKCIFLNEKFRILIKIPLKFVPRGLIDNNQALV